MRPLPIAAVLALLLSVAAAKTAAEQAVALMSFKARSARTFRNHHELPYSFPRRRLSLALATQCSLLSLFGDLFDEKDPLWPESCSASSARETGSDNPSASLPPPTPLAEVYMLSMGCSVILASISICVTRLRSQRS